MAPLRRMIRLVRRRWYVIVPLTVALSYWLSSRGESALEALANEGNTGIFRTEVELNSGLYAAIVGLSFLLSCLVVGVLGRLIRSVLTRPAVAAALAGDPGATAGLLFALRIIRSLPALASLALTVLSLADFFGVELFIDALSAHSAQEVFDKHPEMTLGVLLPWLNGTLLWTIPGILVALYAVNNRLPHWRLARTCAIICAVVTVASFTALGWIIPSMSVGVGQWWQEVGVSLW